MTKFGEVRTAFEYVKDIVPQNYTRDHKEAKASAKQKVKDQPPSKAKPAQKKPAGSSINENPANAKHKKSCMTTETQEEQNKSRYAEIREQVENFLRDSSRRELQFPSSFNSHDRLLVHQVAEELGLVHESKGEGKDRCITVSRLQEPAPAQEPKQEEAHEKEETPHSQRQLLCQPPLDLKGLHLERMKREQEKREENARQKKQQSSTPTASASKKTKSAKGVCDRVYVNDLLQRF